MAEPSERRQSRSRRAAPPRAAAHESTKGNSAIKERLRRDRILFALCLATLGFVTWAGAMTWWVTGAVSALAVGVAAVAPAVFLIYLRDA